MDSRYSCDRASKAGLQFPVAVVGQLLDALTGGRASEDAAFGVNSALAGAHVRGAYRDTAGASAEWADYQLRPNFAVAMAVAPELFDARRAARALATFEARLLGRLGAKTLDAADWAFRPNYSSGAEAAADRATAGGWNYHQGPEWLWPVGYFLRARLRFPPNGRALPDDPAGGDGLGPSPARPWPPVRPPGCRAAAPPCWWVPPPV